MALPCQPNAVRYRRLLGCLHLPRVLQTISGKSLLQQLHRPFYVCSLILINFTSLFVAEHAKKVQLHYTFIRSLSWGKAPEDG